MLITNAIMPGIEHCSSPVVSYKMLIALHHHGAKKFKTFLFDSAPPNTVVSTWQTKLAKRKSSAMRIFLYDFGRRGATAENFESFVKNFEFSIFKINHRRLIEDQQMFYNFKCWLQAKGLK